MPIIVARGKLEDIKIVVLKRDSLSNSRVRGRLFFNNLEEYIRVKLRAYKYTSRLLLRYR